jgi:hypothetical protein
VPLNSDRVDGGYHPPPTGTYGRGRKVRLPCRNGAWSYASWGEKGEAETTVTVVFLAVGGTAFDQIAGVGSGTPSLPAERVVLDLTLDSALAQARDIESEGPNHRGYVLTANVRNAWLGPLPHNVVAGCGIVQVEVKANELNEKHGRPLAVHSQVQRRIPPGCRTGRLGPSRPVRQYRADGVSLSTRYARPRPGTSVTPCHTVVTAQPVRMPR